MIRKFEEADLVENVKADKADEADEADEAEAAAEAGDAAGSHDVAVAAAENAAEEPPQEAGEDKDGGVDEAEVAEDLLALQDVKEEIHSPAEDGVHEVGEPARARQKGLQRPPLPFLPFGLLPPGTVVVPQAVPPGRVAVPTSPPTMPQRTQRVPAPPKTRPPGYSAPTTPKRRLAWRPLNISLAKVQNWMTAIAPAKSAVVATMGSDSTPTR